MAAHGLKSPTNEWWGHLWDENQAYHDGWPPGWVLETADGRIAGFLGNVPLTYFFKGRQLRAATGSAWVVHPDFRSYSLLLLRRFIGQKDVELLLNTTANDAASRVYSVLRIKKVPIAHYDVSLFWVTAPVGFARSLFRKKQIPGAALLSLPVAFGLALKNLASASSPGAAVKEYSRFDGEFDRLWSIVQDGPFLLAARDSATLNWHFGSQLERGCAWAFGIEAGGALQSYAIFVRQDHPEFGLTRVRLVDFQTVRPDFADLAPLLHHARQRARREGIHMVEAVGFHAGLRAALEELAPWRRKLTSWLFFYKALDPQLDADLASPAAWNPSFFDGDGSL
jgi:hypothetical protein